MTEDPKPAASLTADRIKRGAPETIEAASQAAVLAPSPAAEEALRRRVRETVSANAELGGVGDAGRGLLNWRRAGFFGLIYLGALVAFAAVFEVWPLSD
jgi:hypothetical protein